MDPGLSLREETKKARNANRNKRPRDTLCFMVETWARHNTTETVVGGWRLAVGGGWWLATVGDWQFLGGCP